MPEAHDPQVEAAIRQLSNWGRWGAEDELGTVNFITPAKRVEAAGLVRTGKLFSLSIPLDESGPQPAFERRLNPRHLMLATGTDLRSGVQPGSVGGFGEADTDETIVVGFESRQQVAPELVEARSVVEVGEHARLIVPVPVLAGVGFDERVEVPGGVLEMTDAHAGVGAP